MTAEDYQHLESLFLEARDLPEHRRTDFVAEVARRSPHLRDKLERLLTASGGTADAVDLLAGGGGARVLACALIDEFHSTRGLGGIEHRSIAPQCRMGRYTLLRCIGQGGMGAVYEAEQDEPRRRVALKVMRDGLAAPNMLERFRREAQMLGRLRHRGIARIYDACTSSDGDTPPYFVMELIDGPPLLAFAESRRLVLRQRIELMIEICDAVSEAHMHGLVHRDLKPGNILVEPRSPGPGELPGGDSIVDRLGGQPKILDFGVAHSTDFPTLTGLEHGCLIGTIPYMSPEQATGGHIDPRSDVYALGVIAFELLTGRLPYDLAGKMPHEAARIIRDEPPARLGSLDPRLRGDVEAIVAQAMEKDRELRYPAAAQLAADFRRFLGAQPIQARAPSSMFRALRRAWKRSPTALSSAVVLVFAATIVGGLALVPFAGRKSASSPIIDLTSLAPRSAPVAAVAAHPDAVTTVRFADAWMAANSDAESYAFDQFHPGVDAYSECLTGDGGPVTLQLTGGTLTLASYFSDGRPSCAIRDGTTLARTSDAYLQSAGTLVLHFDPPIMSFYGMFGSLVRGATVTQTLFSGETLVSRVQSAPSVHSGNSQGIGFLSRIPIDRIEVTSSDRGSDGGGVLLGAFRHVLPGEPNLGFVHIPEYGGPYGDDVQIDFACVFVRPGRSPSDDSRPP